MRRDGRTIIVTSEDRRKVKEGGWRLLKGDVVVGMRGRDEACYMDGQGDKETQTHTHTHTKKR